MVDDLAVADMSAEQPNPVKLHYLRLNQIKKLRKEIERASTHLERYEAAVGRLDKLREGIDPIAEDLELVTLEADHLRAALVYITTAPTLEKAREVASRALRPNELEGPDEA